MTPLPSPPVPQPGARPARLDCAEPTRVGDMAFSELHLGYPALGDRLCDAHNHVAPLPGNESLRRDVEALRSVCDQAQRYAAPSGEFKVVYDDVPYRVMLLDTRQGRVLVLRRLSDAVGALADLGIAQVCAGQLLAQDLAGLLLVAGPARSGKTTTASTLVKERLSLYGGVAVTVEDPSELPLEGRHGTGICYQALVPALGDGFAEAFERIARWGPNLLFVGEIRDRDTAVQALRASVGGRLVITTIQADSLVKAVMRLQTLVNEKVVGGGAQLLADGLAGVLHQRLMGLARQRPVAEYLSLRDAPDIRRHIADGRYDLLAGLAGRPASSAATPGAAQPRRAP